MRVCGDVHYSVHSQHLTCKPADSSSHRSEAVPSDDTILTQKVYGEFGDFIFDFHLTVKTCRHIWWCLSGQSVTCIENL